MRKTGALLSLSFLLFPAPIRAQSFKGHEIGETGADFLKAEPSIRVKVTACHTDAPRALTTDEIKSRYGRKAAERYIKEQAGLSALGKPRTILRSRPSRICR
jgi:hypothetical protein